MRQFRDLALWSALWAVYIVVAHAFMVTPQDAVAVWLVGGIASGLLIVLPPARWWPVLVPLGVAFLIGFLHVSEPLWLAAVNVALALASVLAYALVIRGHRRHEAGLGADAPWVFVAVAAGAAIRVLPLLLLAWVAPGADVSILVSVSAEVGLGTIVGLVAGSGTVLGMSRWRQQLSDLRSQIDLLLGITVVVLVLVLVFFTVFGVAVPGAEFLIVPLLLVAAVRYPVPVTAFLTGLTVLVTAVAIAQGTGPYTDLYPAQQADVVAVQMYLLVVTVSVFVLASLVSESRRGQQRVEHSAALMTAVFRESPVPAAWVTLAEGEPHHVREANPAFLDLLALPGDEVRGARLESFLKAPRGESRLDLAGGRDVRATGRDGSVRWLRPTLSRRFQDPEALTGTIPEEFAVLVLEDVTADRISEERLKQQSRRDSLTGLPNRVALIEWLEETLRDLPSGHSAGLLLLDIDGLKTVNNGLGFAVGDQVIIELGQRFTNALGPTDLLVRNGGDEFAVLRPPTQGSDTLDDLAERMLTCASVPFVINNRSVSVTISVGSVETSTMGTAPGDLLRGADVALQRAKHSGRRQAARFEPGEDRMALERMGMEELLRDALASDALVCLFQPIVLISTGRVVGAETLVRLRDDQGALVSPDRFLPVAAELGLMGQLTDQVLVQACAAAATWLEAGHEVRVAFNAPPAWLNEAALERIEAAVQEHGIPNSAMTVEVTEEETLSAGRSTIETLAALRALGIHVAIDDFGTGYAGLDSFRSVPADIVKIDRAFVSEMMQNPEDYELVRSMLDLVYRFGKRAVAEGVETQEQYDALGEMGCDYAQGFLLARPLALADFPAGQVLPR